MRLLKPRQSLWLWLLLTTTISTEREGLTPCSAASDFLNQFLTGSAQRLLDLLTSGANHSRSLHHLPICPRQILTIRGTDCAMWSKRVDEALMGSGCRAVEPEDESEAPSHSEPEIL